MLWAILGAVLGIILLSAIIFTLNNNNKDDNNMEEENEKLKFEIFVLENKMNKYKKIFPILNNEDFSYVKENDYFQNKGDLGELIVRKELEYLVKKNNLILFNDLFLSLNEKIMQIDHILISNNCVFIIETKNWSVPTYGSIKSNKWFQYFGDEKKYLDSPIKQNYSHLRFFLSILKQNKDINLKSLNFYNLVVFVGNKLNLIDDFYYENNVYFKALNFSDLSDYIENILQAEKKLHKDYSAYIAMSILKANKFENIDLHFKHVKNIG